MTTPLGRYVRGYYDQSWYPGIGTPPVPPTPPTLTSLTPAAGNVGVLVTVTVAGSGFVAGSVVEADGAPLATTFVSATELTVSATPGAAGTVQVTVRNPDGGVSTAVAFTVAALGDLLTSLTVEDVKALVTRQPDLLAEVYEAEKSGRNRTSLVSWLKALLDES